MAVGGVLSCYFISALLFTASYQFNRAKGGSFNLGFESLGSSLSNPLPFDKVWGSNMLSHRRPVLGSHKCGDGFRGSLITSVPNVWSSTLPGDVKLRLKFCGSVVTFCAVWSLGALLETSYAKSDSRSPDIRGNEENLTFSESSLMVENSN
ncbi:hypothetical protein F2Q70_00013084 [Brassica cretica]|uniref:Uncharacterized protein n=1 Tax=Brassica cretica TaxID=69181 RepID=A0A8S9M1C6_BRACR|nr:hypothetical protein F2Q70_00013084 [Brassica cretica]